MSDANQEFLRDIRKFLEETGMAPSYFGKKAGSHSELVRNLEAGRPCLNSTEARVRKYMAERRASREIAA